MLLIEAEAGKHTIPLEDLAIIVLDHDAIDVTGPLLARLGEEKVALIACNAKHLPSSLLLPYEGHTLMPQILKGQIEASVPAMKRAWQAIISEKLRGQGRLLLEKRGDSYGIERMAAQVKSGDPTNREGVAATIYFSKLFGEGFMRLRQLQTDEPEELDSTLRITNAMLNYGYAVLRACVARAVVLAGLHPALGIYHRHRENTFSLADDLMEPLRVLVDRRVFDILHEEAELPEDLNPHLKREVLKILTAEVRWNDGLWPLDAALEAYAAGVRSCLLGEVKVPEVPGA